MTTKIEDTSQANEPPKHSVILKIILIFTGISIIIGLPSFLMTREFPCNHCSEYPDWWIYVYSMKQVIGLASIFLIWNWRKIGIYGILIFAAINLYTFIILEENIFQGTIPVIVSIGIILYNVTKQWSNFK